jgi:hypothetical protein
VGRHGRGDPVRRVGRRARRGVVIPGVDDTSFAGAAPDPGAYESGATPGRLAVTTALAFSPASPAVNATVTATYTVTNLGGSPVSVQYLMVGVRDPSGGNADIGVTSPLTIQPGQSYTFSMSRSFTTAGTYTAWPASFDGNTWNHLAGTTTFTVH